MWSLPIWDCYCILLYAIVAKFSIRIALLLETLPHSLFTLSAILAYADVILPSSPLLFVSYQQIRVPTHDQGSCLFWEFATDHYDVAFGVYFEWSLSPTDQIQINVSDSSDDEDENEAPNPDGKSCHQIIC